MSNATPRWSEPVDSLLEPRHELVCDVLVIGSGYGGSFAARELAPHAEVWVMERGREYALGEFPEDIGALPGHVRFHRQSKLEFTGNGDALFDVRMFEDLSVLLGNGLGGGSLINAGVAFRPPAEAFAGWGARYAPGEARHGALFEAMDKVERLLGAEEFAAAPALGKHQALSHLAARGGCKVEPVKVTIAQRAMRNRLGLEQAACIHCGNCFTGCNTGAKNTLVSHVIPEAAAQGARFFTGATALKLAPHSGAQPAGARLPARWTVDFRRTADHRGRPEAEADFQVHAHTVVVAAGALGSTELLLRSRSKAFTPSSRLGKGLSTNGDQIAMGWGMGARVNGISMPGVADNAPSRDVGPTITGSMTVDLTQQGGARARALVQDGAVPSALAQAVIALGTALSFTHRYVRDERPPAYPPKSDMLAVPPDIGRHALLLLAMGTERETGEVCIQGVDPATPWEIEERRNDRRSFVRGRLDVRWEHGKAKALRDADEQRLPDYEHLQPDKEEKPRDRLFLEALDEWLEQAEKNGGLQGGDLLGNPAWRPFPKDFALLGGASPRGMVTVHPLGGCGLGNDGTDGVVDGSGAVFRGDGSEVYAGLHVLDGAIVPQALGVNPFLTIAALSMLGAEAIAAQLRRQAAPPVPLLCRACPVEQPRLDAAEVQPAGPIRIGFEERLQGEALDTPAWLQAMVPPDEADQGLGPLAKRKWVAVVATEFDLHEWLANPSLAHRAALRIHHNGFSNEMCVRDEVTRKPAPLAGEGQVTLLALDGPPDRGEETTRFRHALFTYFKRRGTSDLQSLRAAGSPSKAWTAFERAGRLHAMRRVLAYDFVLRDANGRRFRAEGRKLLILRIREKNIWKALTELDLTVTPMDGGAPARMKLKVDLVDLVKHNRLQVLQAPSTPAAMVGLASFASLWLRSIFTTHFWSFGSPGMEYLERLEPARHLGLRPGGLLGPEVQPHCTELMVGRSIKDPDTKIAIELTRYDPPGGHCGDLLMIHGLAHGGSVFTTNTVGTRNMATHFLAQGLRVWVLDHRLSNRLPHASGSHTMDDIAEFDIPAAVRHVFWAGGHKGIHVFAHCVGAGAFSIAALKGRLDVFPDAQPGGETRPNASMVKSAIVHAVHPWVVPSLSNQLSAALAAFFKDALEDDDRVDPLVPRRDWRRKRQARGFVDTMIDRFGFSLPWDEADEERHHRHRQHPYGGCAICNRMTVFYGKEFRHENISDLTHERLGELFGPSGIEVFRHLYFVMLRKRLTDRQGANVYLTDINVRRHYSFPVLFAHGRENTVFDPRSAVRSWHRMTRVREYIAETFHEAVPATHLWIEPGYGHMDFLFGENAHRDVFPKLSRFFEDPVNFPTEWRMGEKEGAPPRHPPHRPQDAELTDMDFRTPRALATGPLVQVRRSGSRRELVLWFEQHFDSTSEPREPTVENAGDGNASRAEDWSFKRLEEIDSQEKGLPGWRRSYEGSTLRGQGAYWTAVLASDTPGYFDNLAPQKIVLNAATVARKDRQNRQRQDDGEDPIGFGSDTKGNDFDLMRAANPDLAGRPGPQFPTLQVKPEIVEAFKRLWQDEREVRDVKFDQEEPVRYDDEVRPVVHLSRYPWWNLWLHHAGSPRQVNWIATSCRWPGLAFERGAIDRMAARMRRHVEEAQPAEALLLLGDQIYVDATAELAETSEEEERGAQRYRDAWQSPQTRRLLASLPSYMVLDDHEYKDSFGNIEKPWLDRDFRNGFEAAFAYQWRWNHSTSHLPRVGPEGVRGFWYPFEIGNIPAFACDTRSERHDRSLREGRRGRLMRSAQFRALTGWLKAQDPDAPKIVCSGGVFGILRKEWISQPASLLGADGWFGYPEAAELVQFIVTSKIRNVVFLSGDYHLSAIAELQLEAAGADPVRALSVACSGWNATLPFANERARDLATGDPVRLRLDSDTCLVSRAQVLCDAPRQYGKLSLAPAAGGWELTVAVHGEHGDRPLVTESRRL